MFKAAGAAAWSGVCPRHRHAMEVTAAGLAAISASPCRSSSTEITSPRSLRVAIWPVLMPARRIGSSTVSSPPAAPHLDHRRRPRLCGVEPIPFGRQAAAPRRGVDAEDIASGRPSASPPRAARRPTALAATAPPSAHASRSARPHRHHSSGLVAGCEQRARHLRASSARATCAPPKRAVGEPRRPGGSSLSTRRRTPARLAERRGCRIGLDEPAACPPCDLHRAPPPGRPRRGSGVPSRLALVRRAERPPRP